eukprot:m.140042 g.140042  ORF g.140042 m.140042 type:complete len:62 (+) comp26394_c0_seq1:68-253(+)
MVANSFEGTRVRDWRGREGNRNVRGKRQFKELKWMVAFSLPLKFFSERLLRSKMCDHDFVE